MAFTEDQIDYEGADLSPTPKDPPTFSYRVSASHGTVIGLVVLDAAELAAQKLTNSTETVASALTSYEAKHGAEETRAAMQPPEGLRLSLVDNL